MKTLKHHFTIFFLLLLLLSTYSIITPSANGFAKTWERTFDTNNGESTYTLVFETPDEVSSNSNWTITTTLLNAHMDELKQYIFFSTMKITAETDTGTSIQKTISFGHYPIGEFPERIYPGGRWGPNTISIDLSNETLNIPLGGAVDITIYATVNIGEFIYSTFLAEQIPTTTFETFSVEVGSIKIVSDSNFLTNYFSYILGAAVGITIFTGLVLRDRRTIRS